jgi:hypothetical protein
MNSIYKLNDDNYSIMKIKSIENNDIFFRFKNDSKKTANDMINYMCNNKLLSYTT